ncbi:centromere protein R isoform X2 [Hyperolius riggenbachi]|uniref:centromere protein R isoform X2 n=1 Tax=Hyperolius riggenbachi TaxID=752182 RepID=UPI0035A2F396
MPARRALHLPAAKSGEVEKGNMMTTQDPSAYSPVTGTRRMSPASKKKTASTLRREGRDAKAMKSAEPESTTRGQCSTEEDNDILELFSLVDKSLDVFVKLRGDLKNVQAVESSSELQIVSDAGPITLDLRKEMQKAKVLICEARRRKRQLISS